MNSDRMAFKPWGRLLQCLESVAWTLGPEHVPIVLSSLPDAAGARGWNAPYSFVHGPAGRNISLAVGLRAAKPHTPLILVMNADSVSLGTNHLIHAARRNVGMTLLLLRAEIMREEGGPLDRTSWQMPAHQRGLEQPSRPLDWVSALDAALVGRVNLDDAEAVIGLVLKAVRTPGFSVIGVTTDTGLATGVLSECKWPEYFENYRAWAKPLREAAREPAAHEATSCPRRGRHVPRYEVRIAGLGGHGVKLAGTVLSEAAGFHEGLWATQRGDYGSATRGGPSTVDVVIGSEPITYPGADHPDALVVLSQQAADRYGATLKRGACLVIDPAEVPRPPAGALTIPITSLAREYTGKPIGAGVVALGCVAAMSGVVAMESLSRSLAQHLPSASLESNLAACAAGFSATRMALGGVTHA